MLQRRLHNACRRRVPPSRLAIPHAGRRKVAPDDNRHSGPFRAPQTVRDCSWRRRLPILTLPYPALGNMRYPPPIPPDGAAPSSPITVLPHYASDSVEFGTRALVRIGATGSHVGHAAYISRSRSPEERLAVLTSGDGFAFVSVAQYLTGSAPCLFLDAHRTGLFTGRSRAEIAREAHLQPFLDMRREPARRVIACHSGCSRPIPIWSTTSSSTTRCITSR